MVEVNSMTSDFKEDQAEKLRKHFEDFEKNQEAVEVDVFSLPSRKTKHNKTKEKRTERKIEASKDNQKEKSVRKRRRRVRFPLIRILLFLFLLLVILVLTYPSWIERLNL